MTISNFFESVWQGFTVQSFSDEDQYLSICLQSAQKLKCPRCGHTALSAHDSKVRQIKEAPILGKRVLLFVPVRRVKCCGIRTEEISWLHPRHYITKLFQAYLEGFCKLMPISHVSKQFDLHWETVRNVDKARLARKVPDTDYSQVTQIMMDEFALHKGHRYATVVADVHTQKVLWIGEGRSRESIRPFFEEMGEHCQHIEAVAMDMNTAFDLEVKMHCPNAEVVYDLFHVIAKYGRDVIDRVRVDRANELKHDKSARAVVKRGRWLLLRNRRNLDIDQEAKLNDLLEANQNLSTVYILKEALKEIWFCSTIQKAYFAWKYWYRKVEEAQIDCLTIFARRLKPYMRGIIASAKYPLGTNTIEGMNNKIKVIKRMAYGYRDSTYFFLKIKDAFPGKP